MNIPEVLRALDAQIAQLQQARQLLSDSASTPAPSIEPAKRSGRPPAAAKAVETKPVGKRTMSEEGKARIAAAQKKRWAKSKKAAKAVAAPVVAKKAAGKQAAAPVKPAAPAKAVTKKVAAPVKKASLSKKPVKAPQAADSAEPPNSTAPPPAVEEIAAEA